MKKDGAMFLHKLVQLHEDDVQGRMKDDVFDIVVKEGESTRN